MVSLDLLHNQAMYPEEAYNPLYREIVHVLLSYRQDCWMNNQLILLLLDEVESIFYLSLPGFCTLIPRNRRINRCDKCLYLWLCPFKLSLTFQQN